MNPKYKFYNTQELYFYFNLNYNRIEVSNNENYPALPFICSDKKSYKYKIIGCMVDLINIFLNKY